MRLVQLQAFTNYTAVLHEHRTPFPAQCRCGELTHLVTTGECKYYSTGVDVSTVQSHDPQQFLKVLAELQKLLARLVTFPLVTVAAINGEGEFV